MTRRLREARVSGRRREKAGGNRFTWDLRYPGAGVAFEGMVMWQVNAEQGPVAVPGQYQVRLTANGGVTQTQAFRIVKDPPADRCNGCRPSGAIQTRERGARQDHRGERNGDPDSRNQEEYC